MLVKAIKRHQEIIELVQTQGFVSTDELVERFDVSPQTIRRDLNELADENKIRRNHGGATIASSSENSSYQTRQISYQKEKGQIALELVKHIPDGATLFIDIGTTPEAVARALLGKHQNLRIVTNNINVATILMSKPDFKVILAGGEVRGKDGGVTGEATLDFISQFRLDFGILGISGIDYDGSLLDFDYHEVRVKRAIIENSRSVLLGVDNSKFGRNAMVKLGTIADVDLIITDRSPPKEIESYAKENDTVLQVVK
nr:DeoR/GlpR family transcriptional regulator [Vibrio neptunius]